MCGIVGKVSLGGGVDRSCVEKMSNMIIHRGPDADGVYVSPDSRVGLGHRRLSIIDLSPLGKQPMGYLGRYWIVFNGEIYNYRELRERLLSEGYRFTSKTDTEVIMALYDKFGKKCVEHLRGMFAFAVYDEKDQTIFCARDRVGKKPFKYYYDGNNFIFASELKAILTQSEYKKELDYKAVGDYLSLQYCPSPSTGFKKINKLEQAHYLIFDLKNKKFIKEKYWNLDFSQKDVLPEKEWKEKILFKLRESVKLRMISDVPLGAFLSGGIDSSAVVALMSEFSQKPVKTFSIGFKEEKFNELPFARLIADKYKTEHTEFVVEPKAMDVLPLLIKHYEEPYADSSALPTYYLSKLTRQFVTVSLNGDGGDENFGGYNAYQLFQKSLSMEWAKPFGRIASRILDSVVFPDSDLLDKLKKVCRALNANRGARFGQIMSHFNDEAKKEMLSDNFKNEIGAGSTFDMFDQKCFESGATDPMDEIFYADINTYLADCLMPKVDIASMAVALEGRSPFLDNEFMELTARIPSILKIKDGQKKYILKNSLAGIVPDKILYRSKKGFGVPLDEWFRGELKDYVSGILLSDIALTRGVFRPNFVKKFLTQHFEGKRNHGSRIWNLLTLELWFREFF